MTLLRVLGDIAATRPDGDAEAAELFGEARRRAETLGMRRVCARVRLSLGTLDVRAGREARGREHIAAAAEEFSAMGMTTWRAEADGAFAAPGRRARRPR